jgi:hypothetical protein
MIDTRAVGQELQDLQHQIVGRIRKGQENVADTIKTWAHAAQTVRPQIPALPKTALTDKLRGPEALTSRLPKPEDLAARLPKPEAMVAGVYDLAEQLLAAQRKLASQVTHAAMPLARQGAAIFGQTISQPAKSMTRTGRKAMPAKPAAKARTAGTSDISAKPATAKPVTAKPATAKPATAKPATAKPATTAAANGAAKKARSPKK